MPVLFATVAAAQTTPPPGTRMIGLFGQSNPASGRDIVPNLRAGVPANRSRVWKLTAANTWATALEPVDGPSGSIYPVLDDISAGVSVGAAMLDALAVRFPNEHFGVIPASRGGTTIAQWAPNSSTASLYGAGLARLKYAKNQGYEISAVVFAVGETDAANGTQASWLAGFTQIVQFLRLNLSQPDLPVIVVGIGDLGPDVQNINPVNWRALQDIQASINIPNVTAVSAAGLDILGDGQHTTAGGMVELGYARAGQALIPYLSPPFSN